MAEGLERRCKRVLHSTYLMPMGYNKEEQEFYQKKMDELAEEKRKKFATHEVNEREKRSRLKKKSQSVQIVSNDVTQRLKEYIVTEENGTEVMLVIQKRLFQSDLEKNQSRLNMPIKKLQTLDFLTEDEKRLLDREGEFDVGLLGPRLQMHEKAMVLKKWRMSSTYNYVLKTNWNNFVMENEKDLKTNSMIQVWSFRKTEKLHFAIACLEKHVAADVDSQNDADVPPFINFL